MRPRLPLQTTQPTETFTSAPTTALPKAGTSGPAPTDAPISPSNANGARRRPASAGGRVSRPWDTPTHRRPARANPCPERGTRTCRPKELDVDKLHPPVHLDHPVASSSTHRRLNHPEPDRREDDLERLSRRRAARATALPRGPPVVAARHQRRRLHDRGAQSRGGHASTDALPRALRRKHEARRVGV